MNAAEARVLNWMNTSGHIGESEEKKEKEEVPKTRRKREGMAGMEARGEGQEFCSAGRRLNTAAGGCRDCNNSTLYGVVMVTYNNKYR